MTSTQTQSSITSQTIEQHITDLLKYAGENPEREGLLKTPQRFRKAFEFFTQGYQQDITTLVNDALFASNMSEMIIVKDIELYSMCEHHLLPFIGKCHVGYIPDGTIIGVSKIGRIAEMFARRLQTQESLTEQIAYCLQDILQAKGVAVVIEAQHLCMMMRGIQKQSSLMKTSQMIGLFKNNEKTRSEFLSLLQ